MRTRLLVILIGSGVFALFLIAMVFFRVINGEPDSQAPSSIDTGSTETIQPTSPPQEDDTEAINDEEIDNYMKINDPDVFLANQTPFNNDLISITSTLQTEGEGFFSFTVTSNQGIVIAQREFANWALRLGLTQDQINNLAVEYR
jgi:hypothetical protein